MNYRGCVCVWWRDGDGGGWPKYRRMAQRLNGKGRRSLQGGHVSSVELAKRGAALELRAQHLLQRRLRVSRASAVERANGREGQRSSRNH